MKIFIKIIALLVLPGTLIFGAIVGYNYYEEEKKKAEELSYVSHGKWEWYNKYQRIQIMNIDGQSILRKVYINKKYIIHAYKKNDYSLSAFVIFVVDCEPGSEIVTSSSYSDGEPIILECNKSGEGFSLSVAWDSKDADIVWEEDLDGFKFREDFGDWDFTKLDQEITLSKAKQKIEKKE